MCATYFELDFFFEGQTAKKLFVTVIGAVAKISYSMVLCTLVYNCVKIVEKHVTMEDLDLL